MQKMHFSNDRNQRREANERKPCLVSFSAGFHERFILFGQRAKSVFKSDENQKDRKINKGMNLIVNQSPA